MILSQLDFIKQLKDANELIEINHPVSTELEITEIVDRFSKSTEHNKALLFTNNGSSFPLLINAYGSEKRIAMALHAHSLTEVEQRIQKLFELLKPPVSIYDKLRLLYSVIQLGRCMPVYKKGKGACQECIHLQPDIHILPVLKCWEHDGGKFITLPLVHTQDPVSGQINVGMYRMQVYSDTTTGMHWHIHKTGALHYEEAKKLGKKIPVAVCLGGDPVYTYCATAPLPEGISEYILAGIIRNKAVSLVQCITQPIFVPSDADIVIEGYVDPNEPLVEEGPFGDHTGFYSLPDLYPVFHITAITHKKRAIYPATIVGIPPQEDFWFIKASERIFLQFLSHAILPEIVDMQMPDYGVAHNLVLVQIKPRYPKHAHKIAHALWGIGQMMLNKVLIITDEPLNDQLYEKIFATPDWYQRMLLSYGPLDALEHATSKSFEGGKIMFDATHLTDQIKPSEKLENITKLLSNVLLSEIRTELSQYSVYYAFIDSEKHIASDQLAEQLNNYGIKREIRLFLFDKRLETLTIHDAIWHFLAHFDPSQDISILRKENCTVLLFDGRIKHRAGKPIPNPTISPDNIIKKVDKQWSNYCQLPFIPSPSLKYKKLIKGSSFLFNEMKNKV